MANEIKSRIALRKDLETNWSTLDPVLLNGEIAIVQKNNSDEKTSYSIRIGDGINHFNDLGSIDAGDVKGLVEVGKVNPTANENIELWIDTSDSNESYQIPELDDETISMYKTWSSFKIDKNIIYCNDTPPIFDKPTDYKDKLWLDTSEQPAVIRRWKGEKVQSKKFVHDIYSDTNEITIDSEYEEKFSFIIAVLPKIENNQFKNIENISFIHQVNDIIEKEYILNIQTFFETFYAGKLTSEGLLTKTYGLYENYQGEFISGKWYSVAEDYVKDAQPTTLGVQVLYELETPETYDLSILPSYPAFIYTKEGKNTIINTNDNSDIGITLETQYTGWETISDLNFNSTGHNVLLYKEIEDLTSII